MNFSVMFSWDTAMRPVNDFLGFTCERGTLVLRYNVPGMVTSSTFPESLDKLVKLQVDSPGMRVALKTSSGTVIHERVTSLVMTKELVFIEAVDGGIKHEERYDPRQTDLEVS
ncbi:MAG: hypothetical protein Q6365_016455 [Candidatus Sigynarchaeota archaeon]